MRVASPALLTAAVTGLFVILAGLVLLVTFSGRSDSLGGRLQSTSIPSAMLDNGKVGDILKQHGLVYVRDNPGTRFPMDSGDASEQRNNVIHPFRRKRQVGEYLYQANRPGMAQLPSTRQATTDTANGEFPLLSVSVSRRSLYDRTKGILANPERINRSREKPATYSLFDGSELTTGGNAGIRLYGSKFTRLSNKDSEVQSFQLFFRRAYGQDLVKGPDLFGEADHDLEGVAMEQGNAYKNDLALTLAEIAGLPIPLHRPVLFQLNGGTTDMYLLREPVSQRQWKHVTSNPAVDFYRSGEDVGDSGWRWHLEFNQWVDRISGNMTMDAVASYVDLENLTDTLIVMMFCGSSDWHNWAIYRDRSKYPYWRWITWDLQTCFSDRWQTSPDRLSKQHWLSVVATQSPGDNQLRPTYHDNRARLFVGLMNQDSAYRVYFIRRMNRFLDRVSSSDLIADRIARYKNISRFHPVGPDKYDNGEYVDLKEIEQFIVERTTFLRDQIRQLAP